ncbi:unnamed protein product [Phytophthora lilii]|uniref:Unnamed protein product n=1 Tax=Phytophthora lilii TaxID=2077276 RepID=A0A9W6XDL9_9STRA|nr:unnamed protein product [Phytophthora lilii]
MTKGSRSAVPATPMKSGGMRGDDSNAALMTPHLTLINERSVSFEDSVDGSDAKDEMEDYEDLEEKAPALAVVTPDTSEDAILSAGRSGGSRSLSQNLADGLEEVAGPEPAYDDYDSDAEDSKSPVTITQPTEQASGYRPPLNGDTPAANKVLGRCYEEMRTSEWIQLFEPTPIRQAVWADLSHEPRRYLRR